ncbi:homeobox protein PKNOX2 isoform X2 [Hydra vulgaris]|uniref:homeobox protein PKNOX2 isoform X1 n=2 Tax=Hydra vulgaris TaxID=6087 RepID=UPI001F5E6F41|nr:homeobox protein PKNOX2-like isoform X1 [Hydra vulgaris]
MKMGTKIPPCVSEITYLNNVIQRSNSIYSQISSQDCSHQNFLTHQLANISESMVPVTVMNAVQSNQVHYACAGINEQLVAVTDVCNLVNEKIAIYRHPLFPLLRILFEKCELATNSIENIDSVTIFDYQIKTFITQMAKENKPFFTDDAEVDGLMLKSLQVLRIHLLELEKVNELCKDFCLRYISCLREKLSSDNIMRTLDISSTPPSSPSMSIVPESNQVEQFLNTSENSTVIDSKGLLNLSLNTSNVFFSSHSPNQELSDSRDVISNDSSTIASPDILCIIKKSRCGKRGVLPKHATSILKSWLFQHLLHPYPSEEEKRILAQKANLSSLQLNNWFINARRRILQPTSSLKNNKKSKQKNAAQKDWTNTIGVYNAYRTEALQQHGGITPQHIDFITPQNATMLVNIAGNDDQVVLPQTLQLVSQIRDISNGYLPVISQTSQASN